MNNFLTKDDYISAERTTASILNSINHQTKRDYYIFSDDDIKIPDVTVNKIITKMKAANQKAAYSVAVNIPVSGGEENFERFSQYYYHNLTRPIKFTSISNEDLTSAAFIVVDSEMLELIGGIISIAFNLHEMLSSGRICKAITENGIRANCYMEYRAAKIIQETAKTGRNVDIMLPELSGKGGTEKVICKITDYLQQNGFRVRFVLISPNEPDDWLLKLGDSVSLHCELEDISANAGCYSKILCNTYIPDIVIATFTPIALAAAYVVKQALHLQIPVTWWMHISAKMINQEGVRQILTLADAHLAISYDIATELETFIPREKIYLVNNPAGDLKNNKAIDRDSRFRLVFVGRLAAQKRVDVILNALSKVKGEWILDIYGNGEFENVLKDRALNLGIYQRIVWHGFVENPWVDIDKCSLLVMPSDYEGFCLSAVEALSRGIPVAITDSTGPCDYIIENYNGFILPFDNPEYLSGLLNNLQDGIIALPDAKNCICSVSQYNDEYVCKNFEIIINNLKNIYSQ